MKGITLTRTDAIEKHPLQLQEIATPAPGSGEILVQVSACGVRRSNLHIIEGEWISNGVPAKLPIVPGHEIVGRVTAVGEGVASFKKGDRAGIQPSCQPAVEQLWILSQGQWDCRPKARNGTGMFRGNQKEATGRVSRVERRGGMGTAAI